MGIEIFVLGGVAFIFGILAGISDDRPRPRFVNVDDLPKNNIIKFRLREDEFTRTQRPASPPRPSDLVGLTGRMAFLYNSYARSEDNKLQNMSYLYSRYYHAQDVLLEKQLP